MPDAEGTELLCIVIDANPLAWGRAPFRLEETIEALLAFLNAFSMLNYRNKVAVFASHLTQSRMLFPKDPASESTSNHTLASDVTEGIKELVADQTPGSRHSFGEEAASTMSAAVSLALCYINRSTQSSKQAPTSSRLLMLQVSPDEPSQHIAMMNSIFTAQRMGVCMDAFVLSSAESVFMQQASHLTDGICFKPPAPPDEQPSLLQHLMVVFLANKTTRRHLHLPRCESVDLRAACFLTKRMIDEGYVCSVCLSVFETAEVLCPTCGTRFSFRTVSGV